MFFTLTFSLLKIWFSDIILRRSRGCFSEMPEMTTADSGRLASSALKRRIHLSWESWQQFYDDVHAVAFLEAVEKENGDIILECSCATGLKGTLTLSFFYDFAANYFSLIRLHMHPQAQNGAKVGLEGAREQDPSQWRAQ